MCRTSALLTGFWWCWDTFCISINILFTEVRLWPNSFVFDKLEMEQLGPTMLADQSYSGPGGDKSSY